MRLKNEILTLMIAMVLGLPATGVGQQTAQPAGQPQTGQSGQQNQPLAPVSAEEPSQAPQQGEETPAAEDPRSFGGAQGASLSSPGLLRGYFIPSFQISEMADSNATIASGNRGWETTELLVGRLDFKKVGRRAQTTAEYRGGATIYNRNSDLSYTMHEFGITESYQGRRWSFLFDDRATYLPESPFGYGGFGFGGALGLDLGGATGSNLSVLNPLLDPNGDLLTARGPRTINNTTVQVQYLAGARSSITLAVSYGFLHFNHAGMLGSRNGTAMLGYNHSFTARDNVGLNYSFAEFRFPGNGTTMNNHSVHVTYGRRISGRMSLSVGAGPQVIILKTPGIGDRTLISWSAQGSANYRARRGTLSLLAYRNTTNGGGVLPGATTDHVTVTWGTNLGRLWSASLGPGYSHNTNISPAANINFEQKYDVEYATASLSRSLGRYTSMFLSYTFQAQSSDFTPCLTGSCGESLQRHVVSVGFDFHPRQISLE